ncbi:VanW family protein [Desulfosporosinus lacus]|uniref:Vancomycin resistance protein YoaR, contains peptidoglycan-binding and VanW domains n=1 Tax=Desulfosporosinus lacus DSM 15449 TaxID=1121420 RepID=A0A1M5PZW6_9FIRM|nr:VanW family protein [Desulfosporosinus lacus]SHH07547.1 Vancomycin resistance protein YoaR, contains peptidoglycan-binding and VanW domains [Desulfosporosinus lacus DSM 15449]
MGNLEESQNHGLGKKNDNAVSATDTGRRNRGIVKRPRTGLNFKKSKKFYISLGLILTVLVLATLSALLYTWDHHLIAEGVSISDVNVGDMTQDQAKETMDKEIERLMGQNVTLKVDQYSQDVRFEDLGLIVSADSALREAYEISRNGSIANKLINKLSTSKKGVNLTLSQEWDDDKLLQKLNQNLESFNKPASDASFEISPQNSMVIKKEQVGRVIDTEGLVSKIKEIDVFTKAPEVTVKYKEQLPLLTSAQLEDQKITGLLASYTTRFDPAQTARSGNVRLAAIAMDKKIIKPGDTLSFNKIVGERTVDAGYKDAYIIVNGKFVPGLAGGICQVSSTLYNTGLLANLSVTQRSNHDLAISYVPLGQDATVAYPDLDLKFNNNTGGYLLIRTKMSNNAVTIELYGKVVPGQEILISDTIESVIPFEEQRLVDETLSHGESIIKQEGQPGYIVKSFRAIKMNGQVIKTETLKESRYSPLPKIIAVGA